MRRATFIGVAATVAVAGSLLATSPSWASESSNQASSSECWKHDWCSDYGNYPKGYDGHYKYYGNDGEQVVVSCDGRGDDGRSSYVFSRDDDDYGYWGDHDGYRVYKKRYHGKDCWVVRND